MGNKIPKQGVNKYAVSMLEKRLIEKHYDCIKCKVGREGHLKAKGQINPTDYSATYDFSIVYLPYQKPEIFINNPEIEYNNDIHMYSNGSLCLYYPRDMRWNNSLHLYNSIIPWTAEWLIFYELYKITGKWEHPFVPHGKIKSQ